MVTAAEMLDLARPVEGWMDDQALLWLHAKAAALPAGARWVEIGVWKGRSLTAVACGLPDGCTLTAVDHWQGNRAQLTCGHGQAMEPGFTVLRDFNRTLDALRTLRPGLTIEVVQGDSVTVAAEDDRPYDVVFIDAGHDTDEVIADVLAWSPCLVPGGLLCGHDWNYTTVREALKQVVPDAVMVPGDVWYRP